MIATETASTGSIDLSEHNSQHAGETLQADLVAEQAIELAVKLQAQLDQLQVQLAWSNRLNHLGMLTAALAHEMGNLLTPIRSYAQLALKNPTNEALASRALNTAVTSTAKAHELIERVMQLASPGEDQGKRSCRVDEVVEEAVASMIPTTKQHRVHVRVRVQPCSVAIDALSLEQVLINLITNACQAMSQGASQRQLSIESTESNDRLALTVADTGPGIPESIRGQLFEPFVTTAGRQGDQAEEEIGPAVGERNNQRQGSGLGLSICKQIIESVGGEIQLIKSERGGRFMITLPRSCAAESD